MNPDQLNQLIRFIIGEVQDLGGYTNTIRLVKFLYLIDLEYYRRYQRTLTNLSWVFHHYGPYSFALAKIGERVGFDLEHEEYETQAGYRGRLFKVEDEPEFPQSLRFQAEVVVKGILKVWADQSTSEILDYVYHRTEPMSSASRGDNLDFSKVAKGTRYFELYVTQDKKFAKRLQASMQNYAQEDQDEYAPLQQAVYDQTFEEGLKALED